MPETRQGCHGNRREAKRQKISGSKTEKCRAHRRNGRFGRRPSSRRPEKYRAPETPARAKATTYRVATSGRNGHFSTGHRELPRVPSGESVETRKYTTNQGIPE